MSGTQSLTGEKRLAPSTIRGYQTDLRLFSEYVCDGRYGWAVACEREFGPGAHPVPICHEWNTITHLSDYEGNPEPRPLTRAELQAFLDDADDQVDRAAGASARAGWLRSATRRCSRSVYGWGLFSGVRLLREGLASRVCAAQRLLTDKLSAAAVVVQGPARRVIGAGSCG